MKNLLKSSFGIFFALFMGVQGIVLQHISEETPALEHQTQEPLELGNVTVGDYTKSLPIIFEAEKVTEQSHIYFHALDFINPFLAQLFFFENLIDVKVNQSTQVDLVFDIKDLKFPTHFFW